MPARAQRRALGWRGELLLVLGLAVVAALLRVYRVGAWPPGVWFDEAGNGVLARALVQRPYVPFIAELRGKESLYLYLLAAPLGLFGSTVWSLRAVSVVAGVLTVPAFYLLARELASTRAALCGAFLLAVSSWHIQFSRIAFRGILLPLFSVLAVALLLRAFRTGRYVWFAACGACLGLAVHTYTPGYLFAFVAIVAITVLVFQQRCRLRWAGPRVGALVAGAALVASPMIVFVVLDYATFTAHSEEVSIFRASNRVVQEDGEYRTVSLGQALARGAVATLLVFNVNADDNPRHNVPGTPGLEFPVAALFVLGVAVALATFRRRGHGVVCLWFFLLLIPGVLSVPTPHALRTIGALPPALVFVTIFIDRAWQAVASSPRRWCRAIAPLAVGLLLLGAAGLGCGKYFVIYARTPGLREAFNVPSTLLSTAFRDHTASGDRVLMHPSVPDLNGQTVFEFFNGHRAMGSFNLADVLPVRPEAQRRTVLLLGEYQADALSLALALDTGHARRVERRDPWGRLVFAELWYPAAPADAWSGLTERYYRGAAGAREPAVQRIVRQLPEWPSVEPPIQPPFVATWSGGLTVPQSGRYVFTVAADAQATLQINGVTVAHKEASPDAPTAGQLYLPAGLHSFQLRLVALDQPRQLRVSWRRSGDRSEPISGLHPFDPGRNGLLGLYYAGTEWSGEPIRVQRDLIVFPNVPDLEPQRRDSITLGPYSIEWRGKLVAPADGTYGFHLLSDDGSELYIDQRLVVDNSGPHSPKAATGSAVLSRGAHRFRLRYMDLGGLKMMRLRWRRGGGPWEPLPLGALQIPDRWEWRNHRPAAAQTAASDSPTRRAASSAGSSASSGTNGSGVTGPSYPMH